MQAEPSDLYAILGLIPSATQAQISHAYRALLRRHHPDTRRRGDASQAAQSDATLQQVLAAYAVLGDPGRRARYDQENQLGGVSPAPRAPQPRSRWQHNGSPGQPFIVAGPIHWQDRPGPRPI